MKTLCVDFDGVIHSYTSGWQGADKVSDLPTTGAMVFLRDAVQHFDVCIYSSRSKEPAGVEAMKTAIADWLMADLGYSSAEADDFVEARLSFPIQKPAAFVTLDDRCVCFDGTFPSITSLLSFKTWMQKDGQRETG